MSTSLTITTVSLRRQLNHHHYSPLSISPSSSSSATGQYITAQDSRLLHWRYDDYTDRNFRIHGQTLLYLFILFSIILLAALLLLYARWFFRLRHLPTGHTLSLPQLIIPVSRPTTTTTTAAAGHSSQQKNGLDRVEIDGIPIVLYQTSDYHQGKNNEMMMIDDGYSDLECCICLGKFEDGDKVKVLPGCSHRYHCDCIDLWLCGHSSCPLCRLPVHVDPPV